MRIFSSVNFRLRKEAFGRQTELPEIAAPAGGLKVTGVELEKTQLENRI
jgi:hypothetical protein